MNTSKYIYFGSADQRFALIAYSKTKVNQESIANDVNMYTLHITSYREITVFEICIQSTEHYKCVDTITVYAYVLLKGLSSQNIDNDNKKIHFYMESLFRETGA